MNSHDSSSLEHILVKSKSKKAHKKDKKCSGCCISECNPDCCTSAFQRLDKLRNQWVNTSMGITLGAVYDRDGNAVTTNGLPDASSNNLTAFYFVNAVRYLMTEECGKLDQVMGWYVDTQSGELVMYQNLYDLNLSPSVSRATLLNKATAELTAIEVKQLKNLEPFWKLSLKAVERVQGNPKEEGNICEISDKCGNRYLVAVNRADGTKSVCAYNSAYSIVVVKLC